MSTVETERRALADDNRAHQAICDWIREDAPISVKMSLMPEHVASLVTRLAALRASAGVGGAQAMRERCARWHDDEARRYSALALNADRSLGAAMYRQAAQEHRGHAAAIRALSTDTDPPGSPDADGGTPVEPRWPTGCIKPGSCSRHQQCMYAQSAKACAHFGKDLTTDIETALAARHALSQAPSGEDGSRG